MLLLYHKIKGLVAQWTRARGYGPRCRGFESLLARFFEQIERPKERSSLSGGDGGVARQPPPQIFDPWGREAKPPATQDRRGPTL